MADPKKEQLELSRQEHIDENIRAKRAASYGYDPVANEWRRNRADIDGFQGVSIIDQYRLNDLDEAGDSNYLGFSDKEGAWFILRINQGAGTFRYARGATDYANNWTNRATLTYGLYHNVF